MPGEDDMDEPGELKGPIPPAPTETFVDMLKRWEEEWEAVAFLEQCCQKALKKTW